LQSALIAQNKVEPALEVSDRARARSLVELLGSRQATNPISVAKPSIAQIKQIAQTQQATLVQYAIVSDKDLYIWVIQPEGKLHFHKTDLSQLKTPLNQIIATSRKTIGARGRDVRSDIEVKLTPEKQRQIEQQQTQNLRQLYQILIKPIATHLPQDPNQRVILLPQGNLNLVPFAALQAEDGNYLIDQHTLLTAPSIQTLELTRQQADRLRQRPSSNSANLVIGNPMMPKVAAQLGDEPTQLRSLPGAETEAKAIAPLLNTQPLIGATATKAKVLERMKTARVIHLATHGLLDSIKGDVPGAIALAPDGTGERNDGLLTAGEIYDRFAQPGKPALSADLVVLSACDTGRGDIKGEGVIGLSRTLFAAGVPSVLVSLWEVPDAPTAFLMTEFYTNWQTRKLDKAQALRQAILTTKRKFPRPLDWAAFTLIGEAE
jgi:CHAT domain-containing protein